MLSVRNNPFRAANRQPNSGRNRVRLMMQPLEERAVPATYTVTNTDDSGTGSFRQAVLDANNNSGADTIDFSSYFDTPRTISLSGSGFVIMESVSIEGREVESGKSNKVALDGSKAQTTRLICVDSSKSAIVSIKYLDLQNVTSSDDGAGIDFQPGNQSLTLTQCTITGNQCTAGYGGGIAFNGGTFEMTDCIVSKNKASETGGGIEATGSSTVTLTRCTVDGNMTTGKTFAGDGGGITLNGTCTLSITDCAVTNNTSVRFAGGMSIVPNCSVTIKNTTIAGNTALQGGGVRVSGNSGNVSVKFYNCTIANNYASGNSDDEIGSHGGGLYLASIDESDTIELDSTIVAANTNGSTKAQGKDVYGNATVVENNSLVQANSDSTITFKGNNNQNGSSPGFSTGSLADNGGPTKTIALAAGSAAIDNGRNTLSLTHDQRGKGYARTVKGTASATEAKTDIGSHELQYTCVSALDTYAENKNGKVANVHSRINSIVITFNNPVDFLSGTSAFSLVQLSPGSGTVSLKASISGNTATLTFSSHTDSNDTYTNPSLDDGNYQLTISASAFAGFYAVLDGNANGTPGDNYATASSGSSAMYRFLGDHEGNDRDCDVADYAQFLAASKGTSAAYDYDGDGDVDMDDFTLFQGNFSTQLGVP